MRSMCVIGRHCHLIETSWGGAIKDEEHDQMYQMYFCCASQNSSSHVHCATVQPIDAKMHHGIVQQHKHATYDKAN